MTESDGLITARDLILEMRDDIKTLLSTSAATEERLKSGSQHFIVLDQKVGELEKRKCPKIPKFPRAYVVYASIVVGFTVLGFLVAIK